MASQRARLRFPAQKVAKNLPNRPGQLQKQTFPGQASSALAVWQEKLDFLRQHEAITADASQKFALRKQIEESEKRIRELSETPGGDTAVAGKIRPGFIVVGAEVEPPPIRPLLRGLENALSAGDLKDSELGPSVVKSLQDERELELAKPCSPDWIVAGVRIADEYFTAIRLGAGERDWQRDFAKTAAPILVSVSWSLQRSPETQAVVIRLCEIVARRLRVKLVWPDDPDRSNDVKNSIYRACLNADELESDDVLIELQGLTVTGPV